MSDKPLNVIFMGTPDFAAEALQRLIESDHNIVCVYSQPPRPKGRGHKVQLSPVHALAEQHNIPVYTPKTLKTEEAQQEFTSHEADIAIVAAYGLLLPKAVLDAPKYGCLNIHASLLPRWRGASPIQHAIWKGDRESGVTIMQMDEGLDTGPMIAKSQVILRDDMTASDLHDILAREGATLVLEVLDRLVENGVLHAQHQDDGFSIYAPLLKKADGIIDWECNAIEIDRQIRALNPWPGVWGEIGGKRFKILKASPKVMVCDGACGQILDKDGHVICGGDSTLQILELQPEGKKSMDFKSALNGGYIDLSGA